MATGVRACVDGGRQFGPDLSFCRTIDRSLVHRAAVAEVFVTDLHMFDERRIALAAQLPLTHLYYSDHLQRPAVFDPLLLIEACRQAGICGAHVLGIPRDAAMLVNSFSLRTADPAALAVGRKPGELRIESIFEPTRVRGGKVRQGHTEQELYLDGVHVGRHQMEVQMASPTEHEVLRHLQRGSAALSTVGLEDVPHPGAVAPAAVGRVQPMNVVLADAVRAGCAITALVAPRFGNRALFDHDYDHLPAMTLTEAARQLALLSVDGSDAVARNIHVVAVHGVFSRFAELDEPVLARTAAGAAGGAVTRDVTFTQGSVQVATIAIGLALATIPGGGR